MVPKTVPGAGVGEILGAGNNVGVAVSVGGKVGAGEGVVVGTVVAVGLDRTVGVAAPAGAAFWLLLWDSGEEVAEGVGAITGGEGLHAVRERIKNTRLRALIK